jgi:hypothetical protein
MTEPNGTGAAPTTVAAQQPLPTPPASLEIPPKSTDVESPEKEDWRRKYDSQRGVLLERQRQWDEWRGIVEARMESLQDQLAVANRQLAEETTTRTQLAQQVEQLPTIQETASRVPQLEQQIDRLHFAMQLPSIVAQAKEVEVTGDDGTVRQERQNAVLDMLLSSTVQGPQWQRMAQELAQTLQRQSPEGLPPARPLDMTPPGGPPPPTGGNSLEELYAQLREAYQSPDMQDRVRQITDAIAEAKGAKKK